MPPLPPLEDFITPFVVMDEAVADAKFARVVGNERAATAYMAKALTDALASAISAYILPKMHEVRDMYVLLNGEQPTRETLGDAVAGEWEEGFDGEFEKLFDAYSPKWVGPGWVGNNTLYVYEEGSIEKIAASFGRTVAEDKYFWDTAGERGRKMTPPEIVAHCGLLPEYYTSAAPAPATQAQAKENVLSNPVELTLMAAHEFYELCGMNDKQLTEAVDNATDDELALALGGLQALGLGEADWEGLRSYRAMIGVDGVVGLIKSGDVPPAAAPAPVAALPAGLPPVPAGLPPLPALPPVPAGLPPVPAGLPPVPPAAAPAAPKASRSRKVKDPAGVPIGAMPREVFEAMRAFTNVGDQEFAEALGISRSSFIAYGKANGKAFLVPTEGQRQVCLAKVEQHLAGLTAVAEWLRANGAA